jgi:hypothetical protein
MALNRIGTLATNGKSFYQSVSGGAQPSTLAGIWNPPAADSDSHDSEQDRLPFRLSDDASFHQLEAAVGSALDLARHNPTADPNQIIEGSIQSAFRVKARTRGANLSDSGTSLLDSVESDISDAAAAKSSAATQSYLQTLRAYGVDPQQFHGDLLGAVMDAQHGHVDPSTVFRHFPVGASLDAVA